MLLKTFTGVSAAGTGKTVLVVNFASLARPNNLICSELGAPKLCCLKF